MAVSNSFNLIILLCSLTDVERRERCERRSRQCPRGSTVSTDGRNGTKNRPQEHSMCRSGVWRSDR